MAMNLELHPNFKRYADRCSYIVGSDIGRIREEVKQKKAAGEDVIDFSSGDIEEFLTHKLVRKAISDSVNDINNGYQPIAGRQDLREQMSEFLQETEGLKISPKYIHFTNGAIQALDLICFTTVNPGSEVIFPDPYWGPAVDHVRAHGGIPVFVPLDRNFQLDLEKIEKAITERTIAIYLNTPGNNPAGSVYKKEALEQLADICINDGIIQIYDEAYRDLVYEPVEIFNPATYDEILQTSFIVRSFSKSHSTTGLRAGYFFTKNETWLKPLRERLLLESSGLSWLTQSILSKILPSREIVEDNFKMYKEKRDIGIELLPRINGFELVNPTAGFYFFPKYNNIPESLQGNERGDYIYNRLFNLNPRIVGIPGHSFGNNSTDYIRFAFSVCKKNDLWKAIEVMGKEFGYS